MSNPAEPVLRHPRRQFLKLFALGTACSCLPGQKWMARLLLDVAEASSSTTAIVPVRIADYPALLSADGSVRLTFSHISGHQQPNAFAPFIVTRGSGATFNTFFAVEAKCTHEGTAPAQFSNVIPGGTSTNLALYCWAHGRRYNRDGTFQGGGSNTGNLLRYTATFDGAIVRVHIPGLGYSVNSMVVQSGQTERVRLDFPSRLDGRYEVKFAEQLGGPWTIVPFSTTVGGPAGSTLFIGTGGNTSLYVDRTTDTGFYQVTMQFALQNQGEPSPF
jgi:nitrite reductase/ring-hydroxylating ferredoxin subunit